MSSKNFKQLIWEDIETIKSTTIPTLSGREMYGALAKYYGIFLMLLFYANLGIEAYLNKIGLSSLTGDGEPEVILIIIIAETIFWGFFFTVLLFGGKVQYYIIFNKTIRPLIKTGDEIRKKIIIFSVFIVCLYLFFLFFISIAMRATLIAHIPTFLITMIFASVIIKSELQRIGIPELPKFIELFTQGKKASEYF